MTKIGILHPGEMGVSVAATAINSGCEVYWVSQGRSDNTRERAEKFKLKDTGSLSQLCQICEVIFSICPPQSAEELGKSVIDQGFKGFYMDANAISPHRSIKMSRMMEANRIHFIDGGIIGGPAWKPGETWLYLSGKGSQKIADCLSKGPLETKIIGSEIGKASALKMCYAAYSKGTTALLAAILATAKALNVHDELYQQWDMDEAGFSERANHRVSHSIAKAWRFEGEMSEIAETLQEAGLPGGFYIAAAEIFHRIAISAGRSEMMELGEILNNLQQPSSM